MKEIHNIDLNLLRLFLRIYECGSVTGAAGTLGITQSAVSHGLRKLRLLVGDPLFVRSGHALQPTSRAMELFPTVAKAFALLDNGLREAKPFSPATCSQSFHLAVTDYVEAVLLPHIYEGLKKIAPHATLKVSELSALNLRENSREWDLMIARLGAELPADFYVQKLWQEHFVTVCAQDHPRLGEKALSLDSFLAEGHIIVGTETAAPGAVDRALAARGLKRSVKITTGFFTTPVRIAASSDLLATIPQRLAAQAQEELAIRIMPVPLQLEPFDISMAWSPRWHTDQAHQWFRSWLKSLFSPVEKPA